MGQSALHYKLEFLPPPREKVEYSKIDFVVARLSVERKAASRYLKELEENGVFESQKVGREILYINKELIGILKQ
ncbi:MAG: hypothetical protein WD577_14525 [Bacteroidales bacterium]